MIEFALKIIAILTLAVIMIAALDSILPVPTLYVAAGQRLHVSIASHVSKCEITFAKTTADGTGPDTVSVRDSDGDEILVLEFAPGEVGRKTETVWLKHARQIYCNGTLLWKVTGV